MNVLPLRVRSYLLAASLVLISAMVIVSIETSHASSQFSVLIANGKLAFKSGSGIYTVNPDGSAQVQITNDGNNRSPAWSSDGTRIVFTRQGPQDTTNFIYVMNANGTSPRRLTLDPDDGRASPERRAGPSRRGARRQELAALDEDLAVGLAHAVQLAQPGHHSGPIVRVRQAEPRPRRFDRPPGPANAVFA